MIGKSKDAKDPKANRHEVAK